MGHEWINAEEEFKWSEDVKVESEVTEIVLVRHGETTWNAAGRIQGQIESELNEVGQKQAVAIAERLGKEARPVAVYSSDLKRAKDTALMISKACFCSEVIEVPELKERHVGSLQGLYWKEGAEKEPEAYSAFFSSQNDLEIPGGGESFDQLCDRSMNALEQIAKKHKGERVIVVTHGGVLRAIYLRITQASSAGKLLNASVNVVHLRDRKWIIDSWSDVSHLSSVGFLQRGFDGDQALENLIHISYVNRWTALYIYILIFLFRCFCVLFLRCVIESRCSCGLVPILLYFILLD